MWHSCGRTPNPVLLSGCAWSWRGPRAHGRPRPPITLTGRGPPRLPAARHFPAVRTHTPAGATVLPALDSPEGGRDAGRGRRQRLRKPRPRPPSLCLSIFPSFHSCEPGREWGEGPGDLGTDKGSCLADPRSPSPSGQPSARSVSNARPGVRRFGRVRLQRVRRCPLRGPGADTPHRRGEGGWAGPAEPRASLTRGTGKHVWGSPEDTAAARRRAEG